MASVPLVRFTPLSLAQSRKPTSLSLPSSFPFSQVSLCNFKSPLSVSMNPRRTSNPNRGKMVISMSSYQPVPATERLISAISYFLPFFNGLQYGRYIFIQYPSVQFLFEPLFPLLAAYKSVPYAGFVAFFALYLGVVRNQSFSRYVRFNSMQAVVLDVLLVLPLLLQRILNPGRGVGFKLVVMSYNVIFLFVFACFVYSVGFCVLGKTPILPFVADAADRQL